MITDQMVRGVTWCRCCERDGPTPYHYSNADVNSGNLPSVCQECHDAGCGHPDQPCNLTKEVPVTETQHAAPEMDPVTKARLQLDMNMGDDGNPLTRDDKARLQAFVDSGGQAPGQHFTPPQTTEGLPTPVQNPTFAQPTGGVAAQVEGSPDSLDVQQQQAEQAAAEAMAKPQEAPDLTALIQAQVQQAVAQLAQQQPAQAISFDDVLKAIDPRDSDAALAMYQWLVDNKRFHLVGTLNGGGYLLHYTEPKGTSKEGYIPGATQGGRMVDAVAKAAEDAGATTKDVGLCSQCYSGVERLPDGKVVTDNGDEVCSSGPDPRHQFHG